jgi:UDP-3-O-[3-hydroxymyristoyl] glucosamine N-acyltransferase
MYLSHVADIVPINILQDGEFLSLGLLSHNCDKMLVGLYDLGYLRKLVANRIITCVITTHDIAKQLPKHLAIAISDDPKTVFYQIHDYLARETDFYWKEFDSEISSDAVIHERAYVAPKNVRIGRGTIVEPNVTILECSIIDDDVVIRSGSVIGGEGFEPKFVGNKLVNILHAGGVLIGNRVEILSNCHIAKGVFNGFTTLCEDTKLNALVHVAHAAKIGQRCRIGGGAVICGSANVGHDVWIGPNSTISSEISIGDGAYITLGSVVTKDVAEGQRVSGNFAIEHSRFISFIKGIR